MWSKPPLYLPTKLQKIIEKTKHFLDYFLIKTVHVSGTTAPIKALCAPFTHTGIWRGGALLRPK